MSWVFENNCNHQNAHFKAFSHGYPEPQASLSEILRTRFRREAKMCIETMLASDVTDYIGLERYARKTERRDYRNGTYSRDICFLMLGAVTVNVPRTRQGYRSKLLDATTRYDAEFENTVIDLMLSGVSTRKVSKAVQRMCHQACLSPTTASNILKKLDGRIHDWLGRRFDKKVVVLVLDAVHLKGSFDAQRRARPVLTGYAIYDDGSEDVLSFRQARSESEAAWNVFCGDLFYRGIQDPALIVTDGCEGLRNAIATWWPRAKQQECIFHAMQDFTKSLKGFERNARKKIIDDMSAVFEAHDVKECERRMQAVLKKYPQMRQVKKMADHLPGLTKFYELKECYWAAAKTSNRLERLFKEIKRRTKSMGRFPNGRSCDRWLYALITRGYTPDYGGKRSALTEFTHNA